MASFCSLAFIELLPRNPHLFLPILFALINVIIWINEGPEMHLFTANKTMLVNKQLKYPE
ncbi:MAG: hypothetical protein A2675_02595 [Candidatus Yonathbacteria bacterium RIFCSPHIGHO2_01_FULL_51_10]|uniref:Uncharacterized protein n=1 Tax=Candidatus Yonathbacteria bacterium RIFCSPHIGHO2_01_FULL_51_10 TaxID=1802723 RepID=A0A1G2S4E7_9BACT|nr:MAG: hypothetical protein A2675_02595 [Candidatus Yonathbacteria bacterium RIFCSPHIGHO2_01_FULL_51_10]